MTTVAEFEHFPVADGLDLYVYPTKRFKTILARAYVHRALGKEATGLAMLPPLLGRGCRRLVTMRKIVLFLEELYGASFSSDVAKVGERHVLLFRLGLVNDKFTPQRAQTLRRGLRFLADVILHPVKEKGSFRKDWVRQERENLRRLIEGRINDRQTYAFERCVETMCADEPFGVYEYGRLEDLPRCTPARMRDLHERVTASAPVHLFVTGDVRPARVAAMVEEAFRLRGRKVAEPPEPVARKAPEKPREKVEKLAVEQGNLMIGCRTGVTLRDPDIHSAVFANAVLGGYPHSKLFANVREKRGLAYSASSWLEKTKGLQFLAAGIDFAKFAEARDTIVEQWEDVRAGKITDEEFAMTRTSILDALRSRRDSPGARISALEEQLLNGVPATIDESVAAYEGVTPASAAAAARKASIDTVYFLTKPDGHA